MASLYSGRIADALAGTPLPAALRATADDSLAAALQIAGRVRGTVGASIASTARDAFVHAFQVGSVVTGGMAFIGAVIALLFLPARAKEEDEVSLTIADEPARWELTPIVEQTEG